MSLFSVIVLCPYGRRETIKISSNSSILQVLEEVCAKQKLNPAEFDICHNKKPLDLSLPIRFTNLPNNAFLELYPTKNTRKDCLVTVALQLESGERIMGDFSPSSTLLDVLKQSLQSDFVNSSENGEPICVYMRQKVTGEALKEITLRSLGLTNGTAIIRLLYRKLEQLESQAHISSPLSATVTADPVSVSNQSKYVTPSATVPASETEYLTSLDKNETITNEMVKKVPSDRVIYNNEENMNKNTFPVIFGHENSSSHSEEKAKSARTENDDCAMECEEIISMNFPSEIERNCDLDTKEEFEEIGNINYIGERHAVLYSLDDVTDIKRADLPDEFFELTLNDVRYLMEDYKRERNQMENQPLLTKGQREREILQKLARYRETVIRIYFPERLVLQAVFLATETVQNVCDFLKNYLKRKDLDFYLYVTPPKEKLSNTKNLLESMLVPAAVVYFGSDLHSSSYLSDNLREMKSDPRAAAIAASESRKGYDSCMPLDIPSSNSSVFVQSESSLENVASSSSTSRTLPKSEKIPKWMKLRISSIWHFWLIA